THAAIRESSTPGGVPILSGREAPPGRSTFWKLHQRARRLLHLLQRLYWAVKRKLSYARKRHTSLDVLTLGVGFDVDRVVSRDELHCAVRQELDLITRKDNYGVLSSPGDLKLQFHWLDLVVFHPECLPELLVGFRGGILFRRRLPSCTSQLQRDTHDRDA